ncbi:MAG: isocitrate/isopropylmalate family dehydrogenase [Pseudomonadota bacterium]
MAEFRIAVFDGDGIGPEVMSPTLGLLDQAMQRANAGKLAYDMLPGGARCYAETGEALPEASIDAARGADAILLSAMGDPAIRYPDGTEITPQVDLRMIFDLYAGVRPCRPVRGLPIPLADPRARDMDFILIRESTEGLFAERKQGTVTDDAVARETLVITRKVTEKVTDFGLDLAARRKQQGFQGRLTLVDKANVFQSFAFMRKVFDERCAKRPDITADHAYVDAFALAMVRRPWDYDVLITENMFGDILSDLAAGLMGGLGVAPSADIGDDHAVFQPCHGSAPDIAGQGKANPTAMILSGAMMLEWLGERHNDAKTAEAGRLLRDAVDATFGSGDLIPGEFGGTAGTAKIADAIAAAL